MTAVVSRTRSTLQIVRRVLGNPTLRRVELAFLAFNTVEYGSWVAILLYAYAETGPASVGLVALAQLLPAAVVAPFGGTLGDRFRRERVLLAAYSLFATWTLLIAAGMLLGWAPPVVYLAAIAASMTLTLVRPAHNALLPGLAHDPSELTAANAVTSIAESSGLLLGPLSAAAILSVAGPGAVLALLALVAMTAAVLVLGLRPHAHAGAPHLSDEAYDAALHTAEEDHPEVRGPAILGGFRALAEHPDARLIVAILSSRMLLIGACDVLFVLIAIEQFGTGESGAAILSAAIGAGGILGGMVAFGLIGRQRLAPGAARIGRRLGPPVPAVRRVRAGGRRTRTARRVRDRAHAHGRRRSDRPPTRRARRGPGPRVRDPRGPDDGLPRHRLDPAAARRRRVRDPGGRGGLRGGDPAGRGARVARPARHRPPGERARACPRAPAPPAAVRRSLPADAGVAGPVRRLAVRSRPRRP